MAARKGDFGIILAAELRTQSTRAVRRNNVIVERKDIENWRRNRPQVDATAG